MEKFPAFPFQMKSKMRIEYSQTPNNKLAVMMQNQKRKNSETLVSKKGRNCKLAIFDL